MLRVTWCLYLWYLMKAGKVVPSSQCRKVERGTGKNISMMSRVAAQPKAPDTLHAQAALETYHAHAEQKWHAGVPYAKTGTSSR